MYNIIIRNIVKIFIFVDSIIIIVVRLWGFATLGLPVRVLVFLLYMYTVQATNKPKEPIIACTLGCKS